MRLGVPKRPYIMKPLTICAFTQKSGRFSWETTAGIADMTPGS